MSACRDGRYEQVGTFNGNPLAMAAARAASTEVLTPEAYAHLDEVHRALAEGCGAARSRSTACRPMSSRMSARRGPSICSAAPVREYRDTDRDRRADHLPRVALPAEPRRVQVRRRPSTETWTTSVSRTEDDAAPLRREASRSSPPRSPRDRDLRSPSRSRTDARSRRSRRATPTGTLLIFHHGSPGAAVPFPTFDRAAADARDPARHVLARRLRELVAARGSPGRRRRARRRGRSRTTSAPSGSSPPDGPAAARTRSRARPCCPSASSRPRPSRASPPTTPTGFDFDQPGCRRTNQVEYPLRGRRPGRAPRIGCGRTPRPWPRSAPGRDRRRSSGR